MVYRLLFNVGLQAVSMPFNKTRGPHVTSCDPGHKDSNLNLIYSSNGKDNRVNMWVEIRHLQLCTALIVGLL